MITSALINMQIVNNATWEDAFQFGTVGDTTWSFTGQTFHMDVKLNASDVSALLSLTSAAGGKIVVDDVVARILHINVDDTTLKAALVPGVYVYDLVMIDGSTPAIRVQLMNGQVTVLQGVTQS